MEQPVRLGIEDAQRLTTEFLTGQMATSLAAIEYDIPPFAPPGPPPSPPLAEVSRSTVELRHVPGASDAQYRIRAYGDTLTMRLQLNVWRFVIVYSVPARDLVDVTGISPRFERWERGAVHAGWTVGWRDAVDPWDHGKAMVETYCYAMLPRDFLVDPMAQLYWRTDIVQMTRAFFLEARRGGVPLTSG
ncbi:MAG TPA: hypothetical protein VEB20_02110 [Azospirillaceae bacterium]|nr:hypothetical protein [Azospirillaceae bacterium]